MRLAATELAPGDAAAAGAMPAVLLHGLFGRARNLARLQRDLAPDRRVVAFDLRSHGRSGHAALELAAMADDVRETIEAVGLGGAPVALLGHSLGGKVAMATALAAPSTVGRLVAADIAPVAYVHGNRAFADAMRALRLEPGLTRAGADRALAADIADRAVRDLLLQNLAFRSAGSDGAPAWQIGLEEIAGSLDAVEGWPAGLDALRFEGPSLFVRGGRSAYVEDAHLPAISRLFPRARVVTIDEAGHWLHVEQPDAFARVVRSFLAG